MGDKSMLFRVSYQIPSSTEVYVSFFDNLAKRTMDIVLSLMGLIILAPVFGLVALAIKRDSPGPVIFRGLRTGRFGKPFYMYKFRTMYEDPKSYQGPKITAQNDQRITPIGRWLRDTKINEFPQLWNVLKGDMSLVGPRPADPEIVAAWRDAMRKEIISVRPGITSPASVIFRHEEKLLNAKQDVMSTYMKSIMPSKLRLDQLYVRNRSFWLDLDVLIWTFLVLLPNLGSYQPPEEYIFWGPIYRLVRRHISWFLIDTLVTFTAFASMGLVWRFFVPLPIDQLTAVLISFGFALLFSMTGAIMGSNRIAWSKAVATDIFDLIPALFVATMIVLVINNLIGVFPSGLILLSSVSAFVGFVAVRYRMRLITGLVTRILMVRPGGLYAREKVLIVGCGQAGQFAARMLSYKQGSGAYHVMGFIDDSYYRIHERIAGTKVIGSREDIPNLVKQHDIGIIIFAIHNINPEERQEILDICHRTQALVFLLPDFLGALDNVTSLSRNGHDISMGINHIFENGFQVDLPHADKYKVTIKDIYPRDHFLTKAEKVFERSKRAKSSLVAMMVEIVSVDTITEKYGQAQSDQLSWLVAGHLKGILRDFDLLGHYDGGKFVILIPEVNTTSIKIIANRLLNYVADTPFETNFGVFRLKLNLGLAARNNKTLTLITLLDQAMADLIVAKQLTGKSGKDGSGVMQNTIFGGELSLG